MSPLAEPGQLDGGGMACSTSPLWEPAGPQAAGSSPIAMARAVKASGGAGSKAELGRRAIRGFPRGNVPAFRKLGDHFRFSPLMFPYTSHAVLLRQEWSTSADVASLFKAPLRQLEK